MVGIGYCQDIVEVAVDRWNLQEVAAGRTAADLHMDLEDIHLQEVVDLGLPYLAS